MPDNLFFFHQSPSVRDGGDSADGDGYVPSGEADDDTDGDSDEDTTSDECSSTGGGARCEGWIAPSAMRSIVRAARAAYLLT